MAATLAVLVSVQPEALAHITQLGLQGEFQQILDHTTHCFSGLTTLDVVLSRHYDDVDEPVVYFQPHLPEPQLGEERAYQEGQRWNEWVISTFQPDVLRHFNLAQIYDNNGR